MSQAPWVEARKRLIDANAEKYAADLREENLRLMNITRIQQKQVERLMEERDALKVRLHNTRMELAAAQKNVETLRAVLEAARPCLVEAKLNGIFGSQLALNQIDKALAATSTPETRP